MVRRKLWNIKKIKGELEYHLAKDLKISPILARLLINRGYDDCEKAKQFLNPSFSDLTSPFKIKNMDLAVKKIKNAILSGEKIMIYGDYDVDGITSTALLTEALRSLGADIQFYIPDRIEEGYGLNTEALEIMAKKGVKLVVTVDCGISAKNEISIGQNLGLEFVITDHHQPPEELPSCLIINPVLEEGQTPWKELAGVGVAFKLAQAVLEDIQGIDRGKKEIVQYLDLVALGTIADIVPLRGDNRTLVKYGLEQISLGKRIGIKALCQVAGVDYKNISSTQVGYCLAPRLNACGRIGDASFGVKLLLTSSEIEAKEIAEKLNEENQNRQAIEAKITDEAVKIVEELELVKEKVLVLASEDWHPGVIGIVASRLVEKYYRPTIVLTLQNGVYKGSGRSIPGFHLQQALTKCQDLLETFGGHSQAAGLSLLPDNLKTFKNMINNIALESFDIENLLPILDLDGEVNLAEVDFNFWEELSRLEPTGQANPQPLLVYRRGEVKEARIVGNSGGHLKLKVKANNTYFDAIGFNMGNYLEIAATREPVDLAFALDKNNWNGKTTLQLVLKDLKSHKDIDNPNQTPGFLDRLFLEGLDYIEHDKYKDINTLDAFYTKVVGVTFEQRQEIISQLSNDDNIDLVREPTNVYDSNAIAVYIRGQHIGYLKRELAKHLASNLDNGVKYYGVVSQITGGNDKNFGINIFLKKIEQKDINDKLRLKQIKEKLAALTKSALDKEIKQAIIGQYQYRPKQLETLELLEKGFNTLAVLGTGRGKSAIFQTRAAYLALAQKKVTVIIYPLRSLVNDQYLSLKNKLVSLGLVIYKATGSLEPEERVEFFTRLENGEIDIILTTPEFLAYNKNKFNSIIGKLGLVVIDESHHLASRRGGYKLISKTLKYFGTPQVLAVTATADDNTGKIIVEKLNIEKIVIDQHIRENLQLIDYRNYQDKVGYIKNLLLTGERTVVYVNSRKKAYTLAADLRRDIPYLKDKIGYYHGGLNSEDRQGVENLFREGSLQLIVTTSAFGEGIDIPDIENVVLYHLCFSKEEYNQLAGRAGRNGDQAKIHLLYGTKDKELNQLLLSGNCPNRQQLGQFYLLLKKLSEKNKKIKLSNSELAEWAKVYKIFGVQEKNIGSWLSIFEELGLIEREIEGNKRTITLIPNPPKVDLEKSIRYLEGIEERVDFEEYAEMAFKYNSGSLLNLINRPIYPASLVNN